MVTALGGSALLSACGGDDAATRTTVAPGQPAYLMPFFATGDGGEPPVLRSGTEQRTPWGLADVDGAPIHEGVPTELEFRLLTNGTQVGEPIKVARYGEGVPFPYFPLRFSAPNAGIYTASVTVGGMTLERDFVVAAPESVRLVQRGEKAIPVDTPTTSDARGVEALCTRDPACPFHTVTLAEALAARKPVAFLVSTPAHCQTSVCGPVLESLLEAAKSRPGITFVHAEVYAKFNAANPGASELAPAVSTYALTYEPSLLVIDAAGVAIDRLDFTWDSVELTQALDRLPKG